MENSPTQWINGNVSLQTAPLIVPDKYVDVNGHMNIGYYSVLFDLALAEPYYRGVGVGQEMIDREGKTTFALESHFTYQREVRAGDSIRFVFRLLDIDRKRAHIFMTMTRGIDGEVSATHETLSMCVDVKSRRSAEWPEWVSERLKTMHDMHKRWPAPVEVGQRIGIRRD
jgi:acyl-CoA thioester hydrolase